MGILQRLNSIFNSKSKEDGEDIHEDPVQMMKLAVAEMEQTILKSTEALNKAIENQKNLVKQTEQYKTEADSWFVKATTAIKAGDDEVGRKALEKKAIAEKQYEQYNILAESSSVTVDQLRTQLDRMQGKLEEAKAKESILSAKMSSAKAQKEIAQQLEGLNYSPLTEFDKYEMKVIQAESESEALADFVLNGSKIKKELEELETDKTVLNDYESIKNKLKEEEEAKKKIEEEKTHLKITQLLDSQQENKNNSKKSEDKKKILDSFLNNDAPKSDQNKQKKIDDFFKKE
jgi:phage shock protein A